MSHNAVTLADFEAGETRMVFARDTASGAVIYMVQGAAEIYRKAASAGHLICIVPGCENPRLKTVNRGERRHGFSHLAGGGHAPMRVAHLQSQLLIARWLNQICPEGGVALEEATEDGSRRADVMLTRPDGERFAFEVQYSALSPQKWLERHASYRDNGIIDIWLWGHLKPHLNPDRSTPGNVLLNPTHAAVAAAGLPLLWIHPEFAQVATVSAKRHSLDGTVRRDVPAVAESGVFHSTDLDGYRLDDDLGMVSDPILVMLRNRTELDRLDGLALMRKTREEARRVAEEVTRLANTNAFFDRIHEKQRTTAEAWLTSPQRARIFELFKGAWPACLGVRTSIDLPMSDDLWQATLYLDFIHGHGPGRQVRRRDCERALESMDSDVRKADVAVGEWLGALVKAQILDRREMTGHGGKTFRGYVVHDPTRHNDEQDALSTPARLEAVDAWSPPDSWRGSKLRAIDATIQRMIDQRERLRCPACGWPMTEEEMLTVGCHFGCG